MDGFSSDVSESAPQLKVFAPTSQLASARTRTTDRRIGLLTKVRSRTSKLEPSENVQHRAVDEQPEKATSGDRSVDLQPQIASSFRPTMDSHSSSLTVEIKTHRPARLKRVSAIKTIGTPDSKPAVIPPPDQIAEDPEETSFWEGAVTSLPSWLVSTLVHLILLILLALFSMGGNLGKSSVLLEFTEAGEPFDMMTHEIDFSEIVVEEAVEFEMTELEPIELEAPEVPLEMMEVLDMSQANQLPNDVSQEFGFGRRQLAGGSPAASGSKDGPGASFFGVDSGGNRFVFVIDCSGSMRGSRWYRAVKELNEAISNLEPTQEFLVLLYNSGMSVMMDKTVLEAGLVLANEDNRLQSKRWLRKQRPNGGTYPSQAMFASLIMAPDAIFLLSDGELQDNTASLLNIWNVDREDSYGSRAKIPIHTISLGPPGSGQRMMKRIAEENSGVFTWVQ